MRPARSLSPCPTRCASRLGLLVLLSLVVGLLVVPSAMASSSVELSSAPPDPVVGESVTFSASGYGECRDTTLTFKVDGVEKQTGTGAQNTFVYVFPEARDYSVSVTATTPPGCSAGETTATATLSVTVEEGVSGAISVAPDPPQPNEQASLSVTPTGGSAPYTYAWDADDDGEFDDGTTRTISTVFPALGPHIVRVRIRDAAMPFHEGVVTRTITASDPQPGDPPAPPPEPCASTLEFALSEFTTEGCFTQVASSPEQWVTTDQVKLNGIVFADLGQRFLIEFPTLDDPGGHVSTPNAAIQFAGFVAYSGAIDWSLPAGEQGDVGTLHEIELPSFAKLFKLPVKGSTAIQLGFDADGTHFAVFPLNVELPGAFKPAPGSTARGGVTGEASLIVDEDGPRYGGLKISVTDVWLGRLKVPEACFSFVPAGGQTAPCDTPSLDGEPYLTCETDDNTDRWDGNAVLELPVASGTQLAAFGGLADGQVSKLGGFADNIAIPIVPGVTLSRIGVGLCLSPPPLKLRGDVGLQTLGGKLVVNGRFLYTDAIDGRPWSVEVGGNAVLSGTTLGSGTFGFNAWGDVDFGLATDLDLLGVVTLEGRIAGWIEPRNSLFNVEGSLRGCLLSLPCATASGLISSTGVAGCLDAGSITVYEPYNARTGPFGFGSISFSTRKVVIPLKAGFGYRFDSSSVDLLGNSCDFSPYSATRSELVTVAAPAGSAPGTGLSERIEPGSKAVTLRIHGSDGPPKVVVRGPGGTTIRSPRGDKTAKQREGRFVVAENETDGTTSVLLVKPAAGEWTVSAASGAASSPTTIDRSDFEAPPTLFGDVRKTADGSRELALGYSVPKGASVRLVERGKGIGQTIVQSVDGEPCRGTPTVPGGGELLCERVKFRPSRGPGGIRRIEAVVTRKGVPMAQENIASFRAPPERLPSRPAAMRARHVGGDLFVSFTRSRGAARYSVTAAIEDGRQLGFDLGPKCRAVRIPDVSRSDKAIVKVAGVRYDISPGPYRRIDVGKSSESVGRDFREPRFSCR